MEPGRIYRHRTKELTITVLDVSDKWVKAEVVTPYTPTGRINTYPRDMFLNSVVGGNYDIVKVKTKPKPKKGGTHV